MVYILIAILLGIILSVNFRMLESIFIILIIFLVFIYLYKAKILNFRNGRFINLKSIKNDSLYGNINKIFIAFLFLIPFVVYSNLKITSYDNKYETSSMSGEFIIISNEKSSEFYNKYICKNTCRR